MRFSLRTTQSLTIFVMGLLAILLALTTGEVYRHLAVENQRTALGDLVGLKTRDVLRALEVTSRDVGLQLQHEEAFRRDFNATNLRQLRSHLENQFHQYFVTAGVLKIERVSARDLDFRMLATATSAEMRSSSNNEVCPQLIRRAGLRDGAQRLKSIGELCSYRDRLYYSVIIPIGGLRPRGYLEVITDPVHSLKAVESALSLPLQIQRTNGEIVHRSSNWPKPEMLSRMLLASYQIKSVEAIPALTVMVASDMHSLNKNLQTTRYGVIAVAGIATLLATFLGLWILQRTAVEPLDALRRHMLLLQGNRKRLGEPIAVRGTNEIQQLAEGFNLLSGELNNLYGTLEHLAYTDSLTELPNRARFQETLDSMSRAGRPFALALIDLDRFKEINDSFGHNVGDQLLKEIGARLKGILRSSDILVRLDNAEGAQITDDTLARLGGDEFSALLYGIDNADKAAAVARKLISVMDAPFDIKGHGVTMSMSLGIALYPEHGRDPMMLLQHADMAMYHAKQGGGGYALADQTRHNEALARSALGRDLHEAIHGQGLELYYQPKIILHDMRICCVEALLRWLHPQHGFIPPDQFIPIAEQTGLIHKLTRWVLDRALEQCAQWMAAGHLIGVSVNISAVNLRDPALIDDVVAALGRWNVPPTALILELTESAIMDDADYALEVLTRFDAMGVGLSIDDFGTGYSSLSYLKRLPVDEIKIDKSFVMDIADDINDAIIVRSTIDLAHNMGLRVVAEGVESEEILSKLVGLNCDMAQGYLISRPMPFAHFLAWLEKPDQVVKIDDRESWLERQTAKSA